MSRVRMSAPFQSTFAGSTSRPPIETRRLWRLKTEVSQPPLENQPVWRCVQGRTSPLLIELGMFQEGLNTISCILLEKIGVCVAGFPTTTRVVNDCSPLVITRNMNSGTLTITYDDPRSLGSQRQR